MNKPVGFFQALLGSCSGTRIFVRLRRNTWGRTLLHLFLMSVLCAAFITVVQGIRTARAVQGFSDDFFRTFGGIRIDPNGLTPERLPEKARSFAFSSELRVFYFPAIPNGVSIPEEDLQLTNYGVIWTPKLVVMLGRVAEGHWQCSEMPVGRFALAPAAIRYLSDAELPAWLSSLRAPAGTIASFPKEAVVLTGDNVVSKIVAGICIVLLVLNFLVVFVLPLLYTAVFAIVFRLTGGRQLRTLSLGEFWRIGIYAGFPVMLFASFFPAFDLPFLRYGTVYMIGLVVYWLVITGRIERDGIEGGEDHNE